MISKVCISTTTILLIGALNSDNACLLCFKSNNAGVVPKKTHGTKAYTAVWT
jgi:hypothetical protein